MSKKLLALFMTLVIISGVMQTVPANAHIPAQDQLLLNLGIIKESRDAEKTVSRGEFAGILVKILELPVMSETDNPFKAEEESKNVSDACYTVFKAGYMGVMDNGKFGASYPVTYDEAVNALVKALGYDVVAANNDYYSQALSIGLVKGIKYEKNVPVSYGDLVRLIKNSLEIDLLKQKGYGNVVTYETEKGVNLLSEHFKVYKASGVVTGTSTATLGIEQIKLKKDEILIDSNIYKFMSAENTNTWLGMRAEVYYHQEENEDEKEIVYISGKNNEVIELTFNDISEGSVKASFKYESEGKTKEAEISSSADLVYNNKFVDFTDDFCLYINDSTVRLIDNDDNGVFDVVIVNSYVNYYVSSISYTDMILRDKYGQQVINLEDAREVRVYQNSSEADISKIKPGNAISVIADAEMFDVNGFKSIDADNSTVYYIYINDKKIAGKVSELTEGGVVIDNMEYKYSSSLLRAIYKGKTSKIALGSDITAFLDLSGSITAYETKRVEGVRFGYLIDAKEEEAPFKNKFKIKVLEENGIVEVYEVSERAELDGIKLDKTNNLTELKNRLIKNGMADRNIIRFETGKDNKVTMIDTVYLQNGYERKENSLVKSHSGIGATLYYNKEVGKIFGGKIILGSAPKVFVVPDPTETNAEDDDYYVTDDSYFGSTGDFYVDSYNSSIRVSDLIVVYDKANFSNTSPAMVITSVGRGIDTEGESVPVFNGYVDGKEAKLFAKSNNIKIYIGNSKTPYAGNISFNKGDVIRCITDKQKRVTSIQYLFNIKNPGVFSASGTNYDSSYRTVYARAVDVSKDILEVSTWVDLSDENYTEAFILSGTPIYVYENDRVTNASIESISTYKPNEITDLADKAFIFSSRSKAKIVLIIK